MRSEDATGTGSVFLNGQEISYTIIYSSRRRSWAVQVKPDATVIVRMPQMVPPDLAKKLVDTKAEWIFPQVGKYTTRTPIVRRYADGETLPFLGTEYPILRQTGAPAKTGRSNAAFVITVPTGFSPEDTIHTSREMMILLFRRMGTKPLEEIIARYAPIAGVEPPKLRIRHQEHKWGCCTPKNGIIINVRVLLAPKIVAEYIVVHELAHLGFRHHQKTFWDEVERLMPEYCTAEKLLKTDGWKFVF